MGPNQPLGRHPPEVEFSFGCRRTVKHFKMNCLSALRRLSRPDLQVVRFELLEFKFSREPPIKRRLDSPSSRGGVHCPAMKALLLRVGIDSTDGGWQAPVCAETGEFAYVPITEDRDDKPPRRGLVRRFDEFIEPIAKLGAELPSRLLGKAAHLDPDFEHLTYGDQGSRARRIRNLEPGDLLVFFAALRPVEPPRRPLVYAIIGLYIIDRALSALEVPRSRWRENAHTRRVPSDDDIVIRAKSGVSGRLARCIAISEFRRRAYRVRRDLHREWGGLGVRDGWLQRSANPPAFNDPARFLRWFRRQRPKLVALNNPPSS